MSFLFDSMVNYYPHRGGMDLELHETAVNSECSMVRRLDKCFGGF
jgi:hypothetical protein